MRCTPAEMEKIEKNRIKCIPPESDFQPFPTKGKLSKNKNLDITDIKKRLSDSGVKFVYSYVMTTINWNEKSELAQYGTGPNFQGGIVTLCTCKHKMRTGLGNTDDWKDVWVAGIAPKKTCENTLFYLMKVEKAFDSQSELWAELDEETRNAKNARIHKLGDLYQPKKQAFIGEGKFVPDNYYTPCKEHSHIEGWENDVFYEYGKKNKKSPLMLKGDPHNSFLWNIPQVSLKPPENKTWKQGQKKWAVEKFIKALTPIKY